jgi:hypothetical protein
LTPKEEEAVIIRMNKNIAGKWDFDILSGQFEIIDLKNWGFSDAELYIVPESQIDFDPEKEWIDMPEYIQNDIKSFRHVIVHFDNEEDASKFFEIIKYEDTGKTKSMWFPPKEHIDTEAKRY